MAVTTVGHLAIGIKHGLTRTEGRAHAIPAEKWQKNTEQIKTLMGEGDLSLYRRIVDESRRDVRDAHVSGKSPFPAAVPWVC